MCNSSRFIKCFCTDYLPFRHELKKGRHSWSIFHKANVNQPFTHRPHNPTPNLSTWEGGVANAAEGKAHGTKGGASAASRVISQGGHGSAPLSPTPARTMNCLQPGTPETAQGLCGGLVMWVPSAWSPRLQTRRREVSVPSNCTKFRHTGLLLLVVAGGRSPNPGSLCQPGASLAAVLWKTCGLPYRRGS